MQMRLNITYVEAIIDRPNESVDNVDKINAADLLYFIKLH